MQGIKAARGKAGVLLAVLIVLFGLARLACSLDDFYIDEIWSFYFARQMSSLADAFRLNHDNNHIVNTLYLYVIGKEPFYISGKLTFIPHRLLSVVTGTVSLWLVWKIAAKRGLVEAFTAVVLTGLSYSLITYTSEARGYGPLIMFALASYLLAGDYLEKRRASAAVLFWFSEVLAFLSHSSFIFIYISLLLWAVVEEIRRDRLWAAIKKAAFLHLVPSVFLVAYYLFFLRTIVYGGGEITSLADVVFKTASALTGLSSGGAAGYVALSLLVLLAAGGCVRLWKTGSVQTVFFLSSIFVMPLLLTSFLKPEFVYFRYFLVCFPFFYLLSAYALAGLYGRALWGKLLFSCALLIFGALNVWSTAELIRLGRGSYGEATRYIISSTPGQEIFVASDHDFRNKLVLGFYSGFFREKKIVYLDSEARAGNVPDWIIRHSVDKDYKPPAYFYDSGQRYTLERNYGFAGVSGWSWFLYRPHTE